VTLFGTGVRCAIIDWALTDADPERWYTTGDIDSIVEYQAVSETITTEDLNLIEAGILDTKHELGSEPPNIPHYRVSDSPVMALLRSWDGVPLTELLDTQGARKLVSYLLTDADPQRAYSINDFRSDTPLGWKVVSSHIDELVEVGLVEEVEGPRSTRYRVDRDSALYQFFHQLNETLVETAEQCHEKRHDPQGPYAYE
jgi:DNA-binding transcriptional ArsR family regulator